MTLGEKIYKLRTKRSMTQEQLAEKIGVSRQSVSKWETDSAIPDIEKSNNTEAQTTQIVQQETDEDSEQIGRPKGFISEFYRSVRCSEDGKIYLKLKCVLVQDSAETQMTDLVKIDESDGNISVDMVKKENGYEGEAEIPEMVNISQVI